MKIAAEASEDGWIGTFPEVPRAGIAVRSALAEPAPLTEVSFTAEGLHDRIGEAPALAARKRAISDKRFVDILVSTLSLAVLWPFMLLIALIVKASSPGPAIYYSPRVGRYGRVFMMPKYRTMLVGSPTCARESTECAFEITPVGKFLRRFGLDELPQFISVVRGDMSLIGPRPLLANDPGSLERAKFPNALTVRPGISGLAQVSGRNAVPARRKARLDAFYARTASLGFDLVLVAKTIGVVISGKGFL